MSEFSKKFIHQLGLDPAEVDSARDELLDEIRAYQLRALRKASGVTQVELAQRLRVSQNRVSRLERGEISRVQVDTLAHYIEALGGTLHVEADINGQRLALN